MLHIAICEDEELYGEKLMGMVYRYLTAHGLSCKIDIFDSDSALLERQAGLVSYDVVFLDVNKKGIDVWKQPGGFGCILKLYSLFSL